MGAGIKSVNVVNSEIDTIQSNAFNRNEIQSITITGTKIKQIQGNAFPSGKLIAVLQIKDCDIKEIERNAINGSAIATVLLENNT